MGTFSFCLPPFSPDYSGICAALFSLGGLVVIHDAAGCTGNYVGFDEPRWYGSHSMVYCSGLRELDAVLGNDEKLMDSVIQTAEKTKPAFLALVGSPVPTVIGTDLAGIASEIEAETGIPSFGFAATGLHLYTKGLCMAGEALIQRFGRPESLQPPQPLSVNLIGDTPLDFGTEKTMPRLRTQLAEAGFHLNASLWDGASLDDIRKLSRASLNIAVSASGARLCQSLKRLWGTPCIFGFPIGSHTLPVWTDKARQAMEQKSDVRWDCLFASPSPAPGSRPQRILILGDQIIAASLRASLLDALHDAGKGSIAAEIILGLPFDCCQELLHEGDVLLAEEADLFRLLTTEDFDMIIGDPLYRQLLPPEAETVWIDFPHFAVSSKLGPSLCESWSPLMAEAVLRKAVFQLNNLPIF